MIAFLEAKRKKAEEEGIPEEGTVEQIKQLEKEQAMDDAEQAEQRAGGSICQSGNSSPTVATTVATSVSAVTTSSSDQQPVGQTQTSTLPQTSNSTPTQKENSQEKPISNSSNLEPPKD